MEARLTTWTYTTLRILHPMRFLYPSLKLKSSLFLSLESQPGASELLPS